MLCIDLDVATLIASIRVVNGHYRYTPEPRFRLGPIVALDVYPYQHLDDAYLTRVLTPGVWGSDQPLES